MSRDPNKLQSDLLPLDFDWVEPDDKEAPTPPADIARWLRIPGWTIEQACCLLFRVDPDDVEHFGDVFDYDDRFWHTPEAMESPAFVYLSAQAAIETRQLRCYGPRRLIRPQDFIAWAQELRFAVPAEMTGEHVAKEKRKPGPKFSKSRLDCVAAATYLFSKYPGVPTNVVVQFLQESFDFASAKDSGQIRKWIAPLNKQKPGKRDRSWRGKLFVTDELKAAVSSR